MTPTSRPRRILVVDDQRDLRHMMATILTAAGHDVVAVGTGDEARTEAAACRPDVVLSDLTLGGGMDGFELAHALRDAFPTKVPHLVAFTGSRRSEDEAAARAAGFGHYLVKPVDLAALLRLIDELP